jgi:hypothetical protein
LLLSVQIKKVIILKDHRKLEFESDRSNKDEISLLKDCSDTEIAYLVEGEALIIRRILNMQVKKDNINQ